MSCTPAPGVPPGGFAFVTADGAVTLDLEQCAKIAKGHANTQQRAIAKVVMEAYDRGVARGRVVGRVKLK